MSTGNESFDPYAQWLGLNLREQPLDHYLLLGLERYEADPALIEEHADERMRLVRSFQTGPRGRYTQKLMNELAAAKLCLLSPAAKRAYDEQLALWSQAALAGEASVEDDAHAGSEPELPPAAAQSASPVAAVLPPPIGVPEPPPVASGDDAESGEEPAAEESAGGLPMPLVAGGLIVGLIGLALIGWTLGPRLNSAGAEKSGTPGGRVTSLAPPQPTASLNEASRSPAVEHSESPPAGESQLSWAEAAGAIEVLQEGSGDVVLSPATAAVAGGTALELEGTEDVLTGWSSPEDAAAWRFRIVRPGFFEMQITYAAGGEAFGRKLELALDEKTKTLELQPTSEGYRTDVLTIAIPQTGPHTLRVSQTSVFDGDLRLKLIRLRAIGTKAD